MPSLLELGITSQQQAAELERDLGVRFADFTPEDCETWLLQTLYLDQFSRTRAVSFAADAAGVTIRTARQWQVENTLGFNNRLEIAVLRYTDVIEVMLLQHAQEQKASPSLLMMLARAHMPEKYGSARRSSPPRDDNPTNHYCEHDPQPSSTSQYDRELLEEVLRDLQNLKQFAGLTEPSNLSPADQTPVGADFKLAHDPSTPSPVLGEGWDEGPIPSTQNPNPNLSPAGGETQRGGAPTPTDQPPLELGSKPAPDPSSNGSQIHGTPQHPEPSTQNPEPPLNRRQRRELQRHAKRQKSHLARAPN